MDSTCMVTNLKLGVLVHHVCYGNFMRSKTLLLLLMKQCLDESLDLAHSNHAYVKWNCFYSHVLDKFVTSV